MSTEFGQFGLEHLAKIKKGIILYNKEHFWDCHEELEDPWIEDMGDNARYVYWVVIQVATSLFHYRNENLAGARGMLKKAVEKIKHCENLKVETPVLVKFLNWNRFKELVRSISEDAELCDFDKLYQFKFSNPEKWQQHL